MSSVPLGWALYSILRGLSQSIGSNEECNHLGRLPSRNGLLTTDFFLLSLSGPPSTQDSTVRLLAANNVTVTIGDKELWEARNARFDLAWVCGYPAVIDPVLNKLTRID